MSVPRDELEEIKNQLQWVTVKDNYSQEIKSNMNIVYKILVPAGAFVTAGVLGTGIYHMFKRNNRKQQMFMRYRILAQGVTVIVAALGILNVKLSG